MWRSTATRSGAGRWAAGAGTSLEEASLVADVETGELGHEPHLPDPYRERAVAAGQRRREPEPNQMTIEEEVSDEPT